MKLLPKPERRRVLRKSQGSPLDLKPWPRWSDSSQVNEIMTRATQLLERMMRFWIAVLVVSICQVVWWAMDRSPPFRVDAVRVTNAPRAVSCISTQRFSGMFAGSAALHCQATFTIPQAPDL